ncbi:MAG: glycosyltransferase [Candidatus Diapherotrites archaeon]|nr:glycosyltransferase [Candidatus Diapherotrites archaeon]
MEIGIFHPIFYYGGGEHVALHIAKAFGKKEIYTLYNELKTNEADGIKIIDVSYLLPTWARILKKIPKVGFYTKYISIIFWETIDIRDINDFDVVITSSHQMRSLITPENVMHVNYCHTPTRSLWDLYFSHFNSKGKNAFFFTAMELRRCIDILVDSRVDHYFVNSEIIKRRLWHYLKRDSVILYPPIQCKEYKNKSSEDFFLHIGRIDKMKQIMPVIKACEMENKKLILIGPKGNDKKCLEYLKNYKGNLIEYKGLAKDKEKKDLLARCKAVIYNPYNEDYGIVPSEALASGKPVIVNDTGFPPILIKKTGFLEKKGDLSFYKGGIITKGDEESIKKAINEIDKIEWDSKYMQKFAKQFDFSIFKKNIHYWVKKWWKDYNNFKFC